MKRHPILGGFTILVGLAPLLFVAIFVGLHGAPVTHWFAVQRLVLSAALLIAGVLLVAAPRFGHIAGLIAWSLLLADAAWGAAVLWPAPDYWRASAQYLFYVLVGVPIVIFLTRSVWRH